MEYLASRDLPPFSGGTFHLPPPQQQVSRGRPLPPPHEDRRAISLLSAKRRVTPVARHALEANVMKPV